MLKIKKDYDMNKLRDYDFKENSILFMEDYLTYKSKYENLLVNKITRIIENTDEINRPMLFLLFDLGIIERSEI